MPLKTSSGRSNRQAIGRYYERTPGIAKQYPKTLEDLLQDKRQAGLARYLRKIYIDPITASKNWGLISGPGGTIMGVYSRSGTTPVKTANFEQTDAEMAGKNSYQHWQFIYLPTQSTAVPISLPQPGASTTPGVPKR
jgi:maltose-binding protein MalE